MLNVWRFHLGKAVYVIWLYTGIEKNLSAIDSELKKTEAELSAVETKYKDKKGKKKSAQSDEAQAKK